MESRKKMKQINNDAKGKIKNATTKTKRCIRTYVGGLNRCRSRRRRRRNTRFIN
jgi:hypothetical protein